MTGRLFILVFVIAFALLGVLITFGYYFLPSLHNSRIVSLMVPFEAIVEPTFDYPRPDVRWKGAEAVAPFNATAYAVLGFAVGDAIRFFRKTFRKSDRS